ncbi:MAG TPA: hypothetical protein VF131_11595 [Blastocatellia bacterium]|nr:hypothetical protein [Blastocatellia bacterium]
MKSMSRLFSNSLFAVILIACATSTAIAQEQPVVLAGAELTRVVPSSFYFEGQSAPTQMRNAAAARFGPKRHVIAGLVDTSGYSSEIRAKYEGFVITDSAIAVGGADLGVGAYGFGFSNDGKFNVFDVAGNRLLSVDAAKDSEIRRPRPLMMVKSSDGLRLYSGRNYVIIAAR